MQKRKTKKERKRYLCRNCESIQSITNATEDMEIEEGGRYTYEMKNGLVYVDFVHGTFLCSKCRKEKDPANQRQ